jgi:hypothetical protein
MAPTKSVRLKMVTVRYSGAWKWQVWVTLVLTNAVSCLTRPCSSTWGEAEWGDDLNDYSSVSKWRIMEKMFRAGIRPQSLKLKARSFLKLDCPIRRNWSVQSMVRCFQVLFSAIGASFKTFMDSSNHRPQNANFSHKKSKGNFQGLIRQSVTLLTVKPKNYNLCREKSIITSN